MQTFQCSWLVLLLHCWWTVTGNTIYVNQGKGRDDKRCLRGLEDYPCQSFEFVSNDSCKLSLRIIVEDDMLLKGVVSFNGYTNLEINGAANHNIIVITCDSRVKNAGFHFTRISNLSITGLRIQWCGYGINLTTFNCTSGMHIQSCTHVTLKEMAFKGRNFTSLVISNTLGAVEIHNSSFQGSYFCPLESQKHTFYPGGVHIQLENVTNSSYSIINSNFSNNTRPVNLKHLPQHSLVPTFSTEYGFGLGGGMGIIFRYSHHNLFSITNCSFVGNMGRAGSGLYMHFEDNTSANTVIIENSSFVNNKGTAGGGLTVGIGQLVKGAENRVNVTSCEFVLNQADYGGGTAVIMIRSSFSTDKMKLISFTNSTWRNNSGLYSPAVDIMAFRNDQFNLGYLPTPFFSDCNFTNNTVNSTIKVFNTTHLSSGVFVVSSSVVYYGGVIRFAYNRYTALKMTSASLHLESGARVYFDSNIGRYGGAVGLYGFSALVGNDDCLLHFYNNSASILGGAIYYETIEQREFIEGKSCFLQNVGKRRSSFTVRFVNNSAIYGGTSIHSISFYSCFFGYFRDLSKFGLADFLEKIGTFVFEDYSDNKTALGTEGMNFQYAQTKNITAVPGEEINISISINDEFNRLMQSRLLLGREDVENSTTIFSNNQTTVYGKPHESTLLLLRTENTVRSSYSLIPLEFLDCPPGFYFDSDKRKCQCTADNNEYALYPIIRCNYDLYRAYILPGYWAGILPHENKKILYVSSYARLATDSNFSTIQDSNLSTFHLLLPKKFEDLEMFMCGVDKKGILCGQCVKNYSAFFHLPSYGCGSNRYCDFGLLFYILSEIVPVVILFSIIVRFSAHFQSGNLNGFIFYCQVISVASVNLNKLGNLIPHSATTVFRHLQEIYSLVYDIFNFEFFAIEPLSFCLWKGAKVMDVIAIKYITTLFTFALIFLLVRIMNCRINYRCCRCCGRSLRPNFSVTSGLSAFLILCYSQCTKITFQILSKEKIISSERELSVTAFGGIYPYFGNKHLLYAIPALISLSTLILLPLVYLLLIPVLMKILSLCGKSEHFAVKMLLKLLCHQRWMPLIDAFQSCFKPNLRYFAGIYFAYRVAVFAVVTFSKNETQLNAVTELVFLLILGFHAIAQPYKEKMNNMVDGFLFLNLAIINGLNILVSASAVEYKSGGNNLVILTFVHIVLVFVPMIGLVAWLAFLVYQAKKKPPSNIFEGTYEDVRDDSLQKNSAEYCASQSLLDTY